MPFIYGKVTKHSNVLAYGNVLVEFYADIGATNKLGSATTNSDTGNYSASVNANVSVNAIRVGGQAPYSSTPAVPFSVTTTNKPCNIVANV